MVGSSLCGFELRWRQSARTLINRKDDIMCDLIRRHLHGKTVRARTSIGMQCDQQLGQCVGNKNHLLAIDAYPFVAVLL